MKLTKNILREHGFHSPYDIAKKLGSIIFVNYVPGTNERLNYHYAYWQYTRFEDTRKLHADFTVRCREEKQPIFDKVVTIIKEKYDIDITDKDPYGAYHPKGTLEKLKTLIGSEGKQQ